MQFSLFTGLPCELMKLIFQNIYLYWRNLVLFRSNNTNVGSDDVYANKLWLLAVSMS